MEQTLSVEIREQKGKGPARRSRRAGKLPGVLYGLGHNASITVDPTTIHKILMEEGGKNKVFTISGGDLTGRHALIKDYQVDPVSRKLIHVDLCEIDLKKKVEVTVPLSFVGKSVGVAEGGVLNVVTRAIELRCLPTQIPKHIDVDVTALKIGDSIHLDQLTMPEGTEKVSHLNPTLVTVVPPTKEEEAAASLAPSAEPEVITEKKEAAEGEAAATAAGEEKGKEKEKGKEEKKK